MAQRKKPDSETPEELTTRLKLSTISAHSSRGDKVSWERKQTKIVDLISQLSVIENQILELMTQKLPIVDEISMIRNEMVKECIHPYDMLVPSSDIQNHVLCKFCNRTIRPREQQ